MNGKLALFLLAPLFAFAFGVALHVVDIWPVAMALGVLASVAFGFCVWHTHECWKDTERENRQMRRALERMNQSFRMRPWSGSELDIEEALSRTLSRSLPATLDYRVTRVKSSSGTKFEVEVIADA